MSVHRILGPKITVAARRLELYIIAMSLALAFLCVAAFAAGLIDSIAGGGGLISLPALLAAGVPPHIALGTNKLQSMSGTAVALANFHRHAKVLWKIAAVGVPFALVSSALGARLALIVPPSMLGKALIILLPPAAAAIFLSRSLLHPVGIHLPHGQKFWLPTIAACSVVGLYDGFFGPGTGTFLILALVLFSRVPLLNASATAKTFNLASNVGAFVAFAHSGSVDYKIGISMALANIAGGYAGSRLAIRHGDTFVRRMLMVAVGALFIYLVWKYYL